MAGEPGNQDIGTSTTTPQQPESAGSATQPSTSAQEAPQVPPLPQWVQDLHARGRGGRTLEDAIIVNNAVKSHLEANNPPEAQEPKP